MKKQIIVTLACYLFSCIFSAAYAKVSDSAIVFLIGDVRSHEHTKGIGDNLIDDLLTRANVFMDTLLLCKLPEQRYSQHKIPAGNHNFSAQQGGKKKNKHIKGVQMEIKAGGIYYFQIYGTDNDMYLVNITKDFAQKVAASLKPASKCE